MTYAANYTPYGIPFETYGAGSALGFAGEYTDATDLIYLRARFMDPLTGSFLTRDPVWGAMGSSMTYNPYMYAAGNPVNFTDPSGQFVCGGLCIIGASILVGALVGGLIDYLGQKLSGAECVNWGSVARSAITGGVLGAFSGAAAALGAAMGVSGAGAWAASFLFEGAIGTAWDNRVNGVGLEQALFDNFVMAIAFEGAMSGLGRLFRNIDLPNFRNVDAPNGRNLDADAPNGRTQCPLNSFSADTMVETPDGDVPISEIEVGDVVLAYDETTATVGEYTVTATHIHDDSTILTVTIEGEEIETTPWHLFYTSEGWLEADDLSTGSLILSLDGTYGVVEAILVEDRSETMYDLTVDEVHTFSVGDGDWVVHNCGGLTDGQIYRLIRDGSIDRPGGLDINTNRISEVFDYISGHLRLRNPQGRPIANLLEENGAKISLLEADGRWYIGFNSKMNQALRFAGDGQQPPRLPRRTTLQGTPYWTRNGEFHSEADALSNYILSNPNRPQNITGTLVTNSAPCAGICMPNPQTRNGQIRDGAQLAGFSRLDLRFPRFTHATTGNAEHYMRNGNLFRGFANGRYSIFP